MLEEALNVFKALMWEMKTDKQEEGGIRDLCPDWKPGFLTHSSKGGDAKQEEKDLKQGTHN